MGKHKDVDKELRRLRRKLQKLEEKTKGPSRSRSSSTRPRSRHRSTSARSQSRHLYPRTRSRSRHLSPRSRSRSRHLSSRTRSRSRHQSPRCLSRAPSVQCHTPSPTIERRLQETSTVPRQFLLQLMGCVLKQRPLVEPSVPSVGVDEASLLHSLTALTRRANPISHTSTDVIQAMLEVIRNSSTLNSDRNQGNESRAKETISSERSRPSTSNISSSAVNGFSHFVNGHKVDSSPPAAVASSSRYPTTTNVAVRTYSSGTSNSTASLTQSAVHLPAAAHPVSASHPPGIPRPPSVAHSLSVPHPPSAPHPHTVRAAAAAPAAYLPYQPAFPPPPTRGYYPQPYPSTSNRSVIVLGIGVAETVVRTGDNLEVPGEGCGCVELVCDTTVPAGEDDSIPRFETDTDLRGKFGSKIS
ncbi:hypothetical protein PYW07_013523 [Mythimna separata]|uniref:Uncharacterized protein n=1 Tax=Mythimna separata TaxID=271217 RepID=A0AAD7YAN6_MYTSE|nr:hypothetical protein PYW07_013523 [Mythimna separata]